MKKRLYIIFFILLLSGCHGIAPKYPDAPGPDSDVAVVLGKGGFLAASNIYVESVNGRDYRPTQQLRLAPGNYTLGIAQKHQNYITGRQLSVRNQRLRFYAKAGHRYQVGMNPRDVKLCAFVFDNNVQKVVAETRPNCAKRGKKVLR